MPNLSIRQPKHETLRKAIYVALDLLIQSFYWHTI